MQFHEWKLNAHSEYRGDDEKFAKAEETWKRCNRPFYRVYPIAIETFSKFKLFCETWTVRAPLPAILISLPVGREHNQIGSILVSQNGSLLELLIALIHDEEKYVMRLSLDNSTKSANEKQRISVSEYLGSALWDRERRGHEPYSKFENLVLKSALQLTCALFALRENPEWFEPSVLGKDKAKWEESHDQAILNRAIRRGHIGWNVGERIESNPHCRRDHEGIRWTGKGRAVAKLVPIKGSIVNRKKLSEVPSGYLDGKNATPINPIPSMESKELES